MAEARSRLPPLAIAYTGLFLLVLTIVPALVVCTLAADSFSVPAVTGLAFAVTTLWLLLFWHVQRRCSSERLSCGRGLVIIAAYLSTGWAYFSFLFVIPGLLIASVASLVIVLQSELQGAPERTAPRFEDLVRRFYRYRMRQ
jgi:heme/copper-type cytochrome/quinol oxidase subunit 4